MTVCEERSTWVRDGGNRGLVGQPLNLKPFIKPLFPRIGFPPTMLSNSLPLKRTQLPSPLPPPHHTPIHHTTAAVLLYLLSPQQAQ